MSERIIMRFEIERGHLIVIGVYTPEKRKLDENESFMHNLTDSSGPSECKSLHCYVLLFKLQN